MLLTGCSKDYFISYEIKTYNPEHKWMESFGTVRLNYESGAIKDVKAHILDEARLNFQKANTTFPEDAIVFLRSFNPLQ